MARLTATAVRARLKQPGKHGDGAGLWLHVDRSDRGHWFLHFGPRGKTRVMTLGSVEHVSLAEAREAAAAARKLIAQGIDPLDQRRDQKAAAEIAEQRETTFTEAAAAYIAAHESGWRNPKHRQQWRSTLATYVEPGIGAAAVAAITTDDVLRVLSPIWLTKPETAARVRGRIETILSFAAARGWRDRDALNPALWRGHLQLMLPASGKVRAPEHHAALDWREAPAFMRALRERNSFGARALEFAILTAARSGEVRGATWAEADLERGTWT
ncbi:MAG: tyrosine-type recombinase/integrase, partial [Acetobacteraceae bacterium]